MGDTRLGGDAPDIAKLTRTALNGLYNNDTNTADCGGATEPASREQSRPSAATYSNNTNTERGARPGQDPVGPGAGVTNPAGLGSDIYNNTNVNNSNTNDEEDGGTRPPAGQSDDRPRRRVGLTYDAAGAHKTANAVVWRGGVLLGSLGEANKRMEGRIGDCRGWGRYIGRVYRGASKKTMVVVETYFPDATYESDNATREDYSQTLGARAAAALPGVSATRWKRGAAPPKPTLVQTKRPKRLLIDDLTMHLRPYACDVDCTIIIMGDLNTDLISRTGYDKRAFQTTIGDLGLVSCADARWPASSCVFKTHNGDETHASSHIDYILISTHIATASRDPGASCRRDPRPLPG